MCNSPMLATMRLCAPRSRQLLLTPCSFGYKAPTSRLLLINPSIWNRTCATGTHNPEVEVSNVEWVAKRAGNVKSGVTMANKQRTVGAWSDEQICKLEELVAAHTIEPEYSESLQGMTKRTTDWTTIGRLLAMDPDECKVKWKSIQDRGMKTGRFTVEEDALIAQRVAEWGDQGYGLWASLGREMGRARGVIFLRYKSVIIPDRSSARTLWTSDMDARLNDGIALYKEKYGWTRVADFMGGGVTADQCANRWHIYLSKAQQEGIKQGDWSHDEVGQLQELVPQYVVKPYWCKQRKVMTRERIDWIGVGQQLNRVPMECANKWRLMLDSKMKQGPFTAEEDALIRQRVAEWGNKGKGLWVSLQKEMGRSSLVIRMRWIGLLATRDLDWVPKESYEERTFTPLLVREKTKFMWTDPMDARLREGVAKYKEKRGWTGIAKYVGDAITAEQCQMRWTEHVSKVHKKGARRGKWSDKEVEELRQLVPQHVTESHWSEYMGVMTKESIDWTAIADKLNRIPKDCKGKWRSKKYIALKKGPFTTEEDALIRQRVAEWGNKGNGLWVSLQKEMGRSEISISSRWRNCLLGTPTHHGPK